MSQFSASGFYRIDTNESIYFLPQKKFTVTCNDVRLGDDNPTEHYVLGDTYRAAERQYVDDLKAQIKALADQVSTLATALSTFSSTGTSNAVVGSPCTFVGGTALGVSAGSVSSQIPGIKTQIDTVSSTFNNGTNDYLSEIITGE
jgi:hypothetical protein